MATVINGFVWTRRCLKCLKSKRIEEFDLTKAEYWCTVCYVSSKPFLEKNMNVSGGLLNKFAEARGQKYSEVISAAEAEQRAEEHDAIRNGRPGPGGVAVTGNVVTDSIAADSDYADQEDAELVRQKQVNEGI